MGFAVICSALAKNIQEWYVYYNVKEPISFLFLHYQSIISLSRILQHSQTNFRCHHCSEYIHDSCWGICRHHQCRDIYLMMKANMWAVPGLCWCECSNYGSFPFTVELAPRQVLSHPSFPLLPPGAGIPVSHVLSARLQVLLRPDQLSTTFPSSFSPHPSWQFLCVCRHYAGPQWALHFLQSIQSSVPFSCSQLDLSVSLQLIVHALLTTSCLVWLLSNLIFLSSVCLSPLQMQWRLPWTTLWPVCPQDRCHLVGSK